MVQASNSSATTIVYSDKTLVYSCPTSNGSWTVQKIGDMAGIVADGPGCQVQFTFTGDSIMVYGATGTEAGVFGCWVDNNNLWGGWWNAYGTGNWFMPYTQMCNIAGIGYGKHTVSVVNDPNSNSLLYFTGLLLFPHLPPAPALILQPSFYATGLMYTTNSSIQAWADPYVQGCGPAYTFSTGEITTLPASSDASTSGSATGTSASTAASASATQSALESELGGFQGIVALALCAIALVALASLLIGCMCCRRKPPPQKKKVNALADAIRDSERSERQSSLAVL
ncbi:hypothetical protein MNV49_004145 [Pseudohyphozyma bogoriensis]|nr:hypothetical protein MNV49_004145 [Pseudohyphozyma bogoriensis]